MRKRMKGLCAPEALLEALAAFFLVGWMVTGSRAEQWRERALAAEKWASAVEEEAWLLVEERER